MIQKLKNEDIGFRIIGKGKDSEAVFNEITAIDDLTDKLNEIIEVVNRLEEKKENKYLKDGVKQFNKIVKYN